MNIQKNVNLQNKNTMRTPCVAEFYIAVKDDAELVFALKWAKKEEHAVHILGGGSNILPAEQVSGLVIQVCTKGIVITQKHSNTVSIESKAGEQWHDLVTYCAEQGYSGIENLALIPGTVGAAPIQNIGAYGVELADCFVELTAVNRDTFEAHHFTKAECKFGYRESIFKNEFRNTYIITSVTLTLALSNSPKLTYPALKQYFENASRALSSSQSHTPSAKEVMKAVIAIRQSKLPDPETTPNAGSFFKNPVVNAGLAQQLQLRFPNIVLFDDKNNQKKIPAGWLIETLGWKGRECNGIIVHPKQALVITNPNQLNTDAILKVAKTIQKEVADQFNIDLEIEPQLFG